MKILVISAALSLALVGCAQKVHQAPVSHGKVVVHHGGKLGKLGN